MLLNMCEAPTGGSAAVCEAFAIASTMCGGGSTQQEYQDQCMFNIAYYANGPCGPLVEDLFACKSLPNCAAFVDPALCASEQDAFEQCL
jgi:hypothetical protein